jgi:HD-like signal output (HDOD) protein/CheY-like chemotaxis protein
MMKRILFVDDEQQTLDALRRLLHRRRNEWEMVFTSMPRLALGQAESAPFDVVVSEMNLPSMDGATLLARIKQLNPAAARIVLSGELDQNAIARALPIAHRFLRKPCDGSVLESAIQRACVFQNLLRDEAMLGLIGQIDSLPSVPNTYWELSRAMDHSDASSAELASIIEMDPAMCVKLLQIVNSAYFGLAQHISSIQEAISYLGTELLRSLVLTTKVFAAAERVSVKGFSLDQFQTDALATATLARRLLGRSPRADDAFTAALVHDIGKVVMALAAPDRCARVLDEIARTGQPAHVVEHIMSGTTHAEIGGYLLGVWGLPPHIVETILFHHAPRQCGAADSAVLAAVHIADTFVDSGCGGDALDAPEHGLDDEFLSRADLASKLPHWISIADEVRSVTHGPRPPLPSRRDAGVDSKSLADDRRASEGSAAR